MRVPNAGSAEVPIDKIVGYLLSTEHHHGWAKAAFFRKHGFTADDPDVLAEALREQVRVYDVAGSSETAFGTRYIVDGSLAAPDGSRLNVRSVWFITRGTVVPRFVTAHPLKRSVQ